MQRLIAAMTLCILGMTGVPLGLMGGVLGPGGGLYEVGTLPPIDSTPKLKVGEKAPDFSLPAVSGGRISLGDYRGKKYVVISFIPAAWTPICSDQWPGYNIIQEVFERQGAMLLGIAVDNIPTLYAWTSLMGELWFPVLSDFWPHGEVAARYGVLRSTGVAERAIFIIDREGLLRYIDVHDINTRPDINVLLDELKKIQ